MINHLRQQFQELFHTEGEAFFSPGRVNLIGEHTDYNGGMVFPCAITYGTYAIASMRDDEEIHFFSNNFKEQGEIICQINDLHYDKQDDWANYAKGVFFYIQEKGHILKKGCNILIEGNIPNGAGLSSSASLEVLTGTIINELYHLDIPMIDIVKIGQEAENKFVGMNCGIMDQFIIGMGKKDHATALDTSTLQFTYAPVRLKEASIVIMNTCKRRGLADSKYNERRSECETALKELQTKVDIKNLCDLSVEEFDQVKDVIQSEVRIRRAKHAISENQRVKEAICALEKDDIVTFGKLMNASHVSLRDDYEVTGIELDTLVEAAWNQVGCIGARMTGAGFGGCAIAIVKNDAIPAFEANVKAAYLEKIGYPCEFYIASIGDGASKMVK